LKIKKADKVKVISGKDRGKIGSVLKVFPREGKIIVEKVHVVKKHKKKTRNQKDPGGIVLVESPISCSKVMVVCASCGKSTRVGFQIIDGKKKRICRKCKAVLD
jgi:large subunit ribosomal protein L24